MSREIALTRGYVTVVDDDDYERLSLFSWYALVLKTTVYAVRKPGRGPAILMHREILGVPPGVLVDHRNHHGLDNRKLNLRPCTVAENQRNQRPKVGGKLRGAFAKGDRWQARIRAHKMIHLGTFDSEIEAAVAYDEAARRIHGEFACLNFPNGSPGRASGWGRE